MELLKFWRENLGRYPTLDALHGSGFFAGHGRQIRQFLDTAQILAFPGVARRVHAFVRVAQWNIEKGKRLDAIIRRIQSSAILKWADVIVLNEADFGMNRSGNRHVARTIAESLEMHMAFGPAYIELTKGIDEELTQEGENAEGLQGNAILSRHPILEAVVVPLPVSFEPYEFREKRYGRRNCLWTRLQLASGDLWIGATHLELRNSPRCRARQIAQILENLPGGEAAPHVLAGDLNVNTFGRGTAGRRAQAIFRLLFTAHEKMAQRLLHPELGAEPLFRRLYRDGFRWEGFNSGEETARAAIGSLEEAEFLPDAILGAVRKRLEPYQGYFRFKLDWLLGKNVAPLRAGQKCDRESGISSVDPGCVEGINYGPDRISDHLPIYADLDLT